MNCPDEMEINAYCDGELDARIFVRLEKHLESCTTCSELVEQSMAMDALIDTACEDEKFAHKGSQEVLKKLGFDTTSQRPEIEKQNPHLDPEKEQ